jgi:6,7-dimethyl-8-ribityllumazine synthase
VLIEIPININLKISLSRINLRAGMEFQRIAIVQSRKHKSASRYFYKFLLKSLKRKGFTLNQIHVFKVSELEDIPRAVKILAQVEKPAPFTSIIAIGVLVKPLSCSNRSKIDFLDSSIMKIGLDFDVHVKNSILIVEKIQHKKNFWNKLANNTTKLVQTSNELINSLTNYIY